MGWRYEHGNAYDVPEEAITAAGLVDLSWHNDACPSFGNEMTDPVSGDLHDLRLWVEHPVEDQRDSTMHRYAVAYQPWSNTPIPGIVTSEEGLLYEGDDLQQALAAYVEVRGVIESALRRKGGS